MLKKPRSASCGRQNQRCRSPAGRRQVLRRPAAAHLHHGDAVALLGEAQRADAAAEAGADDDEVEIVTGTVSGLRAASKLLQDSIARTLCGLNLTSHKDGTHTVSGSGLSTIVPETGITGWGSLVTATSGRSTRHDETRQMRAHFCLARRGNHNGRAQSRRIHFPGEMPFSSTSSARAAAEHCGRQRL